MAYQSSWLIDATQSARATFLYSWLAIASCCWVPAWTADNRDRVHQRPWPRIPHHTARRNPRRQPPPPQRNLSPRIEHAHPDPCRGHLLPQGQLLHPPTFVPASTRPSLGHQPSAFGSPLSMGHSACSSHSRTAIRAETDILTLSTALFSSDSAIFFGQRYLLHTTTQQESLSTIQAAP